MEKRILLRNMRKEDTQDLFEIFSDPQSTKYWLGRCDTMDELKRMLKVEYFSYLKRGLSPPKVIVLDKRVIGVINFNEEFDGIGRIGFILNRLYEHHGYMKEALEMFMREGFEKLGYHRIEALIFHDNEKSARTLKSVGFSYEGTMRSYLRYQGRLIDIDLFSRLRREYDEERIVG